MNEHHYQQLNETIYSQQLENGLWVQVLPKMGFHKTYAILTVDFGSIDRSFIPIGKDEPITVPDGVAHFFWNIKCLKKKITMPLIYLVN